MNHGMSPESRSPGSIPASADEECAAGLRVENDRLREELAMRDLALDGIQTTFVIADRTTAEPTILYCNKKAAELYGMHRADLIGRSISVISRFNVSLETNFSRDNAILASGQKIAFESEVRRPDGTSFWRGVTVVPIFDAAGRLIRSIATGADITAKREASLRQQELQDQLVAELEERQRILSELQLAQKLESVGRLAAGIAHEINTPIQYVGDSIYFLKNGIDDIERLLRAWQSSIDALPAGPMRDQLQSDMAAHAVTYELDFLRTEIPKAFERMTEGVGRVAKLVRSMKEFATPDSTEQSTADINHALQSTLNIAGQTYEHRARIQTDFAELPFVRCHGGALNQVFLNLIVNAAHAIEDAGRDVETGIIVVSTRHEGPDVVIRIQDNGCGIPPENLEKIYDPFFTTKEVGRGSGQGLAIARSIVVEKHGGELSVSSNVGAGTEFLVRLPIAGLRGAREPARQGHRLPGASHS